MGPLHLQDNREAVGTYLRRKGEQQYLCPRRGTLTENGPRRGWAGADVLQAVFMAGLMISMGFLVGGPFLGHGAACWAAPFASLPTNCAENENAANSRLINGRILGTRQPIH